MTTTFTAGRDLGQFCKALARAQGDIITAESVARAAGWANAHTAIKALVTALSQEQIQEAFGPITADLVALLRPLTIVGRLQPGMRRVPFNTRLLTQSVGGSGDWVGEGRPIPVTAAGLDDTFSLEIRKVGAIRVLTTELMRVAASGSDQLVANDAASSLVEAMDVAFIDPANGGTADKPASITYGAPSFSSSGSSVTNIDADLKLLVQSLIDAEMPLSSAAWIMSSKTATNLAFARGTSGAPAYPNITARGGSLAGLPVITSTSVHATGSPGERFIALVEASEISIADDNDGRIELSTNATLQMDDAPVDGAAQLHSLWQLGLVGIKSTRFLNWTRRRDGAVALLRDVTF